MSHPDSTPTEDLTAPHPAPVEQAPEPQPEDPARRPPPPLPPPRLDVTEDGRDPEHWDSKRHQAE